MISVEEALKRVLAVCNETSEESVPLSEALGRALAQDMASRRTQPPVSVSAMDGYAVKAGDVAAVPATLNVVGEAPAGGAYDDVLEDGQAVRIFTGGPVPAGANCIILQEDTERDDSKIRVLEAGKKGQHIREAGIDFRKGAILLEKGRKLSPADVGLLASMNWPHIPVRRKPRVALLATGDELVPPGSVIGPNQIVSSNSYAISALVEQFGAQALDLGIAPDNEEAIQRMAATGKRTDIFVTLGGASVGERDLVQSALAPAGLKVDFWKIAMRPGKPLIFGEFGNAVFLGLPGNPVSALVGAILFLVPMIRKMLGTQPYSLPVIQARLTADLPANKQRQDYIRAEMIGGPDNIPLITPFSLQDSSVLRLFAHADALVIRPPRAHSAKAGDLVPVLPLRFGSV